MHRFRRFSVILGVILAVTASGLPAATAKPVEAVNPAPAVVPSLQQWTGGTGRLGLRPGTRVSVAPADAAALKGVADQLGTDLGAIAGWRVTVVVDATPRADDVVLRIDPAAQVGPDTAVAAKEGYRLEVTDGVDIVSRTATGAFWATRSLLQMLVRESPGEATVPVGSAVDWPNYAVRGFMLDVGRRWFDQKFVRDYVRYMSWFKLNTFQLHLNDNEITAPGGDWSKAQSAFRLASDNPKFAGLAANDGAFTRADWNRLESVAADHHVTIVPEIDAPAHARSFIEFDPRLGLNGGNSDHLDLSRPATTEFMKEVFDEFTPWFRGPAVHVGADEYPREYAAQYRQYFNDITAHVRELGKSPSAWGSLSVMSGGAAGYDRDVTINSWNNGWYGPRQAIADGYPVINTNYALLYVVPFANYYHGSGLDGRWLFDNWEPNVFPGQESVDRGEPLLRGAMSAVWNDLVHADYDGLDVHRLIEPAFGVLAQKMWRGADPGIGYPAFLDRVATLGNGPGNELIASTLTGAGDPRIGVSVDGPGPLPAGESVTVTATVTNNSATKLTNVAPKLFLDAEGVTSTVATRGSTVIAPGNTAVWSWRLTAAGTAPAGTTRAAVEVPASHRGVLLTKRAQIPIRTVPAAPPGSQHLSFSAKASASSVEAGLDRLAAHQVNDGDMATRWASAYTDGEWLRLDLAQPARVTSARLFWEAACASSYRIQVSTDGTTWRDAATVGSSTCKEDTVTLNAPEPVRQVRMQGTKRATTYGYSLYELWLFGQPAP
ncbi:family 20 glycosylhydrolase [Kribbella sp. CA-293567]|uniref:family 20 glycosylhydrolase n=1 Tax=Kribbella sp. CA-293567 TaxID=3002436 RepID=UPI0022DE3EFC|nr:family 20 glycosylhydrolase [Kribbella sp. CA-293567]WBQ08241.1 family 20 glycosylhydrolase [Kribbella sp. CA-293567]